MATSAADVRALTSKVAAHKTALGAISGRKAAVENQHKRTTRNVAAILNKLLALVNDEVQFGKDIVGHCSGLNWQPTSQASIPEPTAMILRRWHRGSASRVHQLEDMTEAEAQSIRNVKSEASALHSEMTAFYIEQIQPMNEAVARLVRDCGAEKEALPRRKANLVATVASLKAEQATLIQTRNELQSEASMLQRHESDMSEAKGLAYAGGALGLAGIAVGTVLPPVGLMLGIGSLFFGGLGHGMMSKINRKVKAFNKRCEQFQSRAIAYQIACQAFERDAAAFHQRVAELPVLEKGIRNLVVAYGKTNSAAEKLDKDCLELHSAMLVVSSRVGSILATGATLSMPSSAHDNLVLCASAVLEAFTEDRARSDSSVKAVISRLAVAVETMKANGQVADVLRNLEERDDYLETLQREDDEQSFLMNVGCASM